jgi:hypothetical protein
LAGEKGRRSFETASFFYSTSFFTIDIKLTIGFPKIIVFVNVYDPPEKGDVVFRQLDGSSFLGYPNGAVIILCPVAIDIAIVREDTIRTGVYLGNINDLESNLRINTLYFFFLIFIEDQHHLISALPLHIFRGNTPLSEIPGIDIGRREIDDVQVLQIPRVLSRSTVDIYLPVDDLNRVTGQSDTPFYIVIFFIHRPRHQIFTAGFYLLIFDRIINLASSIIVDAVSTAGKDIDAIAFRKVEHHGVVPVDGFPEA